MPLAGRGGPLTALLVAFALAATGCGASGTTASRNKAGGDKATSTSVNLAGRVQRFDVPSRNHVQGHVTYPQTPPVGGDHNPVWMNCGVYSQPVVTEDAVHSMEHGAVWIVYRPNLPRTQVDALVKLARGQPYVLLSPWTDTNIPAPIVASAWGLQLKADTAADPAVAAFVRMYAGGPQAPEPGAPCSGAFGSPQ
jgi:hypothetical protein